MIVKQKKLVSRKPLTNEYTLLCRKCGHIVVTTAQPRGELALLVDPCPNCTVKPEPIPEPIPQLMPESAFETPKKTVKPKKTRKKINE